jgi:ubiquinone/menaquinone biosynthesis C-methylase UbiE
MVNENKKIFNKLAQSYKNLWVNDIKEKRRVEKIVKIFGLKKGMCVLEPGCGRGEFTPFILNKTGSQGKVYLVDIADKMMNYAKNNLKKYKNIKFFNCCASKIPLQSQILDMVVVFNSFPHFYPKEKFIKEFNRLLKEKGILIICHDMPSRKINELHNKEKFNMKKNILPDKKEMFKMLMKQGFVVKKYENKEYYFLKAQKQ